MAKELPTIGELEIQVLQQFWEQQPCTERQVWEAINDSKQTGRTTILKTIQRLESKGLLTRIDSKSPVQFKTTMKRQRVLPALVKRFVDTVLGGASDPLVAYLANTDSLSQNDLQSLAKIAQKLDEEATHPNRKGTSQ